MDLPGYFLSPLFHKNIALLFVCTLVVFWMVFAGVVREIRHEAAGSPCTLRFCSRSRRFSRGIIRQRSDS